MFFSCLKLFSFTLKKKKTNEKLISIGLVILFLNKTVTLLSTDFLSYEFDVLSDFIHSNNAMKNANTNTATICINL